MSKRQRNNPRRPRAAAQPAPLAAAPSPEVAAHLPQQVQGSESMQQEGPDLVQAPLDDPGDLPEYHQPREVEDFRSISDEELLGDEDELVAELFEDDDEDGDEDGDEYDANDDNDGRDRSQARSDNPQQDDGQGEQYDEDTQVNASRRGQSEADSVVEQLDQLQQDDDLEIDDVILNTACAALEAEEGLPLSELCEWFGESDVGDPRLSILCGLVFSDRNLARYKVPAELYLELLADGGFSDLVKEAREVSVLPGAAVVQSDDPEVTEALQQGAGRTPQQAPQAHLGEQLPDAEKSATQSARKSSAVGAS